MNTCSGVSTGSASSKRGLNILDLISAHLIRGQSGVELVIGDEAALLGRRVFVAVGLVDVGELVALDQDRDSIDRVRLDTAGLPVTAVEEITGFPEILDGRIQGIAFAQAAGCGFSADLSGAKISKADLTGADLSGANLSGANLHRAVLVDADLSSANMTRADLIG